MLSLVNILILFFTCLIIYQIILETKVIEGLETQYKDYDLKDPNNALILAQQNAGNISYLKERIDDIQGLGQIIQDLSGNVQTLQTQVNGLVQSQEQYANQLTGGTTPQITGATDDTTDNTDNT